MQLLIDGKVKEQLSDIAVVAALKRLTELIGMTPVGDVLIERFEGRGLGISAVQFLAESHIIVNYLHSAIAIDVFSCRDFDHYRALGFCYFTFEMTEVKATLLRRDFMKGVTTTMKIGSAI